MGNSNRNLLHKNFHEKLPSVVSSPTQSPKGTDGAQRNVKRVTCPDRQHLRSKLPLKVLLQLGNEPFSSTTVDVSPGGLSLYSKLSLIPGTPLNLKLSFGGVCYLNLSGQVVYCRTRKGQSFYPNHIGIAFSGVRDWEQLILISSLKEIEGSAATRDKSVVTILLSPDKVALEASSFTDTPSAAVDEDLTSPQTPQLSIPPPIPQDLETIDLPTRSSPEQSHFSLENHCPEKTSSSAEIPIYPLMIDGKEIDTQNYKYCFLADKLLEEPRTSIKISRQLRAGFIPPNLEEYVFAKYCTGTKELNRQALQAAACASKTYRYFPLSKRMQIASDIHRLLLEKKDLLIELMIKEGHPKKLSEWEFLGMEQAYRKPSLEFFEKEIMRQIPGDRGEIQYLIRRPDGVVGVCPPRNAPCSSSLIGGFALLAGNALVVKPPLHNPTSTLFLWKDIVHTALDQNGAPPGTLNLVLGNSTNVIEEWISSPCLNDILFIGNTKVGLDIGSRAFQAGKKTVLELSGNDMMFVWRDADLIPSVQSLADGFLGSTQICMVPKKAFIHSHIYPTFEALFLEKIKTLRIGLPSDPRVNLSPVSKISEFFDFLGDALEKGAELLCGGKRVNHMGKECESGRFITPTVLRISSLEQAKTMKCIQEENFFPLIPLVQIGTSRSTATETEKDNEIFHHMIETANNNTYGLRISAWVRSKTFEEKFMDQLQNSGLLKINCRHIGFSPFLATHGGTKQSGGPYGELNYIWQKTSHLQGVTVKST